MGVEIIRNMLGKEEYCRKAYILLIPLMVADNYAANKNRGGKGTVLSGEINKIIFFGKNIGGIECYIYLLLDLMKNLLYVS